MTSTSTTRKSLVNTFGLTDEQRTMRESVLGILDRALPQHSIRELDEAKEFPHAAYDALAQAGYLAIPFPEELGGAGGSFTDLTVLLETLGYHYAGLAQGIMTTLIYAGQHVAMFGAPEVREELVPKIVAGDVKLALAMSEPGTGSDLAGVSTSAVREGDEWVLNGTKVWITCAHIADYLVVVTKTDKEAARHRGMTTFLVPTDAPGVTIKPLSMLGRRTSTTNEVHLDNVRIPANYILSEENGAWKNLMACLGKERLSLAAISAGNCFRITEYARDYAQQRIAFGHPISDFQVIQHKLVDMHLMAETARQSAYRVAALLDAGEDAIVETSMAKIVCTDNNFKCADIGLQILGGAGYSMEYDMQMYFRDSRVGPIGGGSNEIQRNIIAKRIGL